MRCHLPASALPRLAADGHERQPGERAEVQDVHAWDADLGFEEVAFVHAVGSPDAPLCCACSRCSSLVSVSRTIQ